MTKAGSICCCVQLNSMSHPINFFGYAMLLLKVVSILLLKWIWLKYTDISINDKSRPRLPYAGKLHQNCPLFFFSCVLLLDFYIMLPSRTESTSSMSCGVMALFIFSKNRESRSCQFVKYVGWGRDKHITSIMLWYKRFIPIIFWCGINIISAENLGNKGFNVWAEVFVRNIFLFI